MIDELKQRVVARMEYAEQLKNAADRLGVLVQELKSLKSICLRKGIKLEDVEKQLAILECKAASEPKESK